MDEIASWKEFSKALEETKEEERNDAPPFIPLATDFPFLMTLSDLTCSQIYLKMDPVTMFTAHMACMRFQRYFFKELKFNYQPRKILKNTIAIYDSKSTFKITAIKEAESWNYDEFFFFRPISRIFGFEKVKVICYNENRLSINLGFNIYCNNLELYGHTVECNELIKIEAKPESELVLAPEVPVEEPEPEPLPGPSHPEPNWRITWKVCKRKKKNKF